MDTSKKFSREFVQTVLGVLTGRDAQAATVFLAEIDMDLKRLREEIPRKTGLRYRLIGEKQALEDQIDKLTGDINEGEDYLAQLEQLEKLLQFGGRIPEPSVMVAPKEAKPKTAKKPAPKVMATDEVLASYAEAWNCHPNPSIRKVAADLGINFNRSNYLYNKARDGGLLTPNNKNPNPNQYKAA